MEINDKVASTLFAGNLFNIIRLMNNHYVTGDYMHSLVSLGELVHPEAFEHVWATPAYTRWQEVYNDPTSSPGTRRTVEWQLFQSIMRELAVAGFTVVGNANWSVTVKVSGHTPDIYDVIIHKTGMSVIRKYPDTTMGLGWAFEKLALAAELISNGYNPYDLGNEC